MYCNLSSEIESQSDALSNCQTRTTRLAFVLSVKTYGLAFFYDFDSILVHFIIRHLACKQNSKTKYIKKLSA